MCELRRILLERPIRGCESADDPDDTRSVDRTACAWRAQRDVLWDANGVGPGTGEKAMSPKFVVACTVALSLMNSAMACHRCGRPQCVQCCGTTPAGAGVMTMSAVPATASVSAMAWSPAVVPVTTTLAPVASPMLMSTGYAPAAVFSPMTISTAYVSSWPVTCAPAVTGDPATLAAAAGYSTADLQALQAAQQQGLIADLLWGIGGPLVRNSACQVCQSLGCCGSAGTRRDPVQDLRETLRGITDTIREIKNLEKEFKDAFDSVGVEPPAVDDSATGSLAELQKLRDELRAMNSQPTKRSSRLAGQLLQSARSESLMVL
jgi:hypothetical protein